MTVKVKITLLLGALVSFNLAVWGAKQILAGLFDPIIRALGA